ncbi:MAG TPA: class I SAM-dependent rRNA methyltransferase [Phycisphaerae bacterium]|nr:class I SAM-dependent rRNA methyltransferase [Phycisphaerae bacterium]
MTAARSLDARLNAALARRKDPLADPKIEAVRLFHGRADGIDNLVVEKWGPVLIVQLHEGLPGPTPDELRPVMNQWRDRLAATSVYLKHFVRDRGGTEAQIRAAHSDPTPWIGEAVAEEIPIRERDLTYLIRPYDGFSVGLFLEHRDNRRRIAELARGRRVLNAFAYTCGFSVAAARGGAASVASVDLSRRYLEWGKRNFAANALSTDPHRFYCSDYYEFLKRARRQNLRFDLAILDPPTFSRRRRPTAVFELRAELPRLVSETIERLDPGGILFLATNDRQLRLDSLEAAIRKAAPHRPCTVTARPGLPPDFAGDPEYAKSVVARLDS